MSYQSTLYRYRRSSGRCVGGHRPATWVVDGLLCHTYGSSGWGARMSYKLRQSPPSWRSLYSYVFMPRLRRSHFLRIMGDVMQGRGLDFRLGSRPDPQMRCRAVFVLACRFKHEVADLEVRSKK